MIPTIVMLVTYAIYTLVMKQELTGASVIVIRKSLLQWSYILASKIFSSMAVFTLLRRQLGRLSYEISNVMQGLPCSIASLLSLTSCLSAKVSLDRMTEFLQKTELLDSFADKQSQVDNPMLIERDDIGFNNATFTWSVEHDGASTPSQRTFRLHISGEQLFKRDCINLIIGPTWVFILFIYSHYDYNQS
jgi:hypothetical protein